MRVGSELSAGSDPLKKLKNHRIDSIDQLYIHSRTGVVIGNSTWSESHVSGTGGTNNTALSISTSVSERQRFFIREADGDEVEVNDALLGVRDGHVVTVVYCGKKNSTNNLGWMMGSANRNTQKTCYKQDSIDTLTGKPNTGEFVLTLGPGVPLLLAWTLGGQGWAFLPTLLLSGLVVWWFLRNNKAKGLSKEVRKAIDEEVDRVSDAAQALKTAQNAPPAQASVATAG